uniref:Cytochrome c oxidase subunit NDUFA4 n=1 Tax=Ficedula albicollis TaxID=59894 RepID=A0A803V246_FICAL
MYYIYYIVLCICTNTILLYRGIILLVFFFVLLFQLIPLFVIIGSGGVGAGLYLMRLAMFNPDVSWDKKNNPEPWNKMSPSDQYKFVSINMDYSRLKKDRPDF